MSPVKIAWAPLVLHPYCKALDSYATEAREGLSSLNPNHNHKPSTQRIGINKNDPYTLKNRPPVVELTE